MGWQSRGLPRTVPSPGQLWAQARWPIVRGGGPGKSLPFPWSLHRAPGRPHGEGVLGIQLGRGPLSSSHQGRTFWRSAVGEKLRDTARPRVGSRKKAQRHLVVQRKTGGVSIKVTSEVGEATSKRRPWDRRGRWWHRSVNASNATEAHALQWSLGRGFPLHAGKRLCHHAGLPTKGLVRSFDQHWLSHWSVPGADAGPRVQPRTKHRSGLGRADVRGRGSERAGEKHGAGKEAAAGWVQVALERRHLSSDRRSGGRPGERTAGGEQQGRPEDSRAREDLSSYF